MSKLNIYIALIMIYAMVAWVAWEYAVDAWRTVRRRKSSPPPAPGPAPQESEGTQGQVNRTETCDD